MRTGGFSAGGSVAVGVHWSASDRGAAARRQGTTLLLYGRGAGAETKAEGFGACTAFGQPRARNQHGCRESDCDSMKTRKDARASTLVTQRAARLVRAM
ncbi:uncharacterized protein EKO05_0002139 [Ascochyta rabiei]|uniref:uncharacterized protein n=1 Tax=Didymella rabiei TaxID=5454 RepID=UPI0021FFBC1A|nr:uncharacterized protein EKO05_0002139 [Ascochyta rabiei]UPX11537.1 hypothetical protein EKO05_0002139 [Ascochyta rabiei]